MLQSQIKNPFQYLTPEQINSSDALNLFVDVFKDYYQVLNPGNTFINGPRGSGKSMMFRIMKPDCQMLKYKKKLNEIDFYSIHVPIKDTSLNITELKILEDKHGAGFLNEHYLVIYFVISIFDSLNKEDYSDIKIEADTLKEFQTYFYNLLKKTGYESSEKISEKKTASDLFAEIRDVCLDIQSDFIINYLSRLICGDSKLPYNGPLCLYQNFLFPLLKRVNEFSFLPNSPIYLLIDDADELNLIQTKILNSWVSYRSTSVVCFKISTQLRYLTYFTTRDTKIDSPHDYFEISLNQIYTSEQRERYFSNVKEIVEKRLDVISGIKVKAEDFFPENKNQALEIKAIEEKLRAEKFEETGDKGKAYDYAYRNSRPNYMTSMSNQYTYSYAGFEQLVHLSSGIIRNFLDLSAKMYTSAYNVKGANVELIDVGIQNDEIKKYSINLLSNEFEKLIDDKHLSPDQLNRHKKLRNLIESVGKAFRVILESNSSERRKFSFYFDNEISDDLRSVLKLGVVYGYFHFATLGSKSGLGRSKLYVLNRMLAPYFRLDPLSFSGYLYLTSQMLDLAVNKPDEFIKKIKQKEYDADKESNAAAQLTLFDDISYGIN